MSLLSSSLHDEKTFYHAFIRDLEQCTEEVIIESPYITSDRMATLWPVFRKLLANGVKIYLVTRDPREHYEGMEVQSEEEITKCEIAGIQVLLCVGNHHRKLAFLDRKVLWEGSLNILSQTHSRELMRRIEDQKITLETFNFLKLQKLL